MPGNTVATHKHTPERTCVGCGQKHPKREMVRIVRTPQGSFLVDITGKTPGRGAYLCYEPTCWKKGAVKRNLSRSLNVDLPTEDLDRLYSEFQAITSAPLRED